MINTNLLNHKILKGKRLEKAIELKMKGSKKARDILIRSNMKFVYFIVNKYCKNKRYKYIEEEIFSVATIGLIKAVDSYDPSKGVPLTSYAGVCIHNEINMFLRKEKKWPQTSLNKKIFKNSEHPKELHEVLEDYRAADELDGVEYKYDFNTMLDDFDKLSPMERDVAALRYGLYDGVQRRQSDVADMVGYSRTYIVRVLQSVAEKLSKADKVTKQNNSKYSK